MGQFLKHKPGGTPPTPYSTATHAWQFINYLYFLSLKRGQPLTFTSASGLSDSSLRQKIYGGKHFITVSSPVIAEQTGVDMSPDVARLLLAAPLAQRVKISPMTGGVQLVPRDEFRYYARELSPDVGDGIMPYWNIIRKIDAFIVSLDLPSIRLEFPALTEAQRTALQRFFLHRPLLPANSIILGDSFLELSR